jgi:hypothetical protein
LETAKKTIRPRAACVKPQQISSGPMQAPLQQVVPAGHACPGDSGLGQQVHPGGKHCPPWIVAGLGQKVLPGEQHRAGFSGPLEAQGQPGRQQPWPQMTPPVVHWSTQVPFSQR